MPQRLLKPIRSFFEAVHATWGTRPVLGRNEKAVPLESKPSPKVPEALRNRFRTNPKQNKFKPGFHP